MTESRALRSSKRQKVSNQTAVEERNDDADAAKQASSKPVGAPLQQRSSGRLKSKPKDIVANDAAAQSKPSTKVLNRRVKESESTVKRESKPAKLRSTKAPTRKPRAKNKRHSSEAVWDVPVEGEELDYQAGGEILNGSETGLPVNSPDNGGGIGADTQLQNELADTEDIAAEPQDTSPYAAELQDVCAHDEPRGMLILLVKYILERLNGKWPTPLKGLETEYQTVHHLVEQTVVAGEGNSMLLLGSRGCGKTTVVESVISSLGKAHRDDFHVVRLNGFLHTDDKIALREIWHQLGRDSDAPDDVNKPSSYADTMASLLALLSPEPTDQSETMTTAKSVVIILDEFDLFTYHPRQTLLYNLFDIAQAKKAPIAVLGMTTKVDVLENLEKRVKSRFSHRYVFLPRPQSFVDFSEICRASLKLDPLDIPGRMAKPQSDSSDAIRNLLESSRGQLLSEQWNRYLEALWADPPFQKYLQQIFQRTRCPKDFFSSALLPLSNLILSSHLSCLNIPTPKSFSSQTLSCPDPGALPFPPMSTGSSSTVSLPLSLLLAGTRLTALHEKVPKSNQAQPLAPLTLTFSTVYAEYVRLLTSAKASASASGAAAIPGRIWGKEAARDAWEKLIGWGLIVPASGNSTTGDGRSVRIEISFEEVVDALGPSGSGALSRWWRDG